MMILGPLVAPSTSTVTEALSSAFASEVIVSPSTARTTGRVSVEPTSVVTLSISMTSPTATFCCLAPARTIAYTAVSFVVFAYVMVWSATRAIDPGICVWIVRRMDCHTERARETCRGPILRTPPAEGKTWVHTTSKRPGERLPGASLAGSALARALLLDRDVLHVVLVVALCPVLCSGLGHGGPGLHVPVLGRCPDAGHGASLGPVGRHRRDGGLDARRGAGRAARGATPRARDHLRGRRRSRGLLDLGPGGLRLSGGHLGLDGRGRLGGCGALGRSGHDELGRRLGRRDHGPGAATSPRLHLG